MMENGRAINHSGDRTTASNSSEFLHCAVFMLPSGVKSWRLLLTPAAKFKNLKHMDRRKRNQRIIISATLILLAMAFASLFNRVEENRNELLLRVMAIEDSRYIESHIPQAQFKGLSLQVVRKLFGDDIKSKKFVYDKKHAVGVNRLIPEYYSGHAVVVMHIPYNDGYLHIWCLDGHDEVIWDAFVKNTIEM